MPDGPNPGQSYEAWIESMAGACPPEDFDTIKHHDWPMEKPPPFAADDEDDDPPDSGWRAWCRGYAPRWRQR